MTTPITKEHILKFDKPGPRYTSYPTAPEWTGAINADTYTRTLAELGQTDKTISLYIHIPFCETLCYFCACSMAVRPQEEKYGNEYLDHLEKEIDLVARAIGKKMTVRQLHWGGGTPSFLNEDQMRRLFNLIEQRFHIDYESEIAIEIDPRRVTKEKIQTLKDLGFNRMSIGVQDLDEKVQRHINRDQPFELIAQFNTWCREYGIASLNYDLIYGLPYQTVASFCDTVQKVISLKPDRIALYSFAYLPWLKKHHAKLSAADIPDAETKLDIFLKARELFLANGYDAIAMDHFALREDELARAFKAGTLYRNFMGYTVKPADEYIGLGTSAIGFLQHAYFQNYKTIPEYYRFLRQGELPIERGQLLSTDDQIRQWVINSLMCRFQVNKKEFQGKFDRDFAAYFAAENEHLHQCRQDGLIKVAAESITVTDFGKLFIRNICMGFDWYLRQPKAHKRFSKTI